MRSRKRDKFEKQAYNNINNKILNLLQLMNKWVISHSYAMQKCIIFFKFIERNKFHSFIYCQHPHVQIFKSNN